MDGTFAEQAVDRGAFDHAHLHPSTLGGGSWPRQGIVGGEQAVAAPPRIGQRRLDGMTAIEPQALRCTRLGAAGGVLAGGTSMLLAPSAPCCPGAALCPWSLIQLDGAIRPRLTKDLQ